METTDLTQIVDGLPALVRTFLASMPGFVNFKETGETYALTERAYKDELVAAYEKLVVPLLSVSGHERSGELHQAVLKLLAKEVLPSSGKPQNLLGWRILGYLGKLTGDDRIRSGVLIYDLLRGNTGLPERLDRFFQGYFELLASVMQSGRQAQVRSLGTLLLMLDQPKSHIVVRNTPINALTRRLLGRSLVGHGAMPTASEYDLVHAFAEAVGEGLVKHKLPPRDMIDVQSFMWVVGAAPPNLPARGSPPPYTEEPTNLELKFDEIRERICDKGLLIEDRTLRRYHAALRSRGFVVLAGLSGSGKTWLTRLYAEATGARYQPCAVAPNWTGPEDLLGYRHALNGQFQPTAVSSFLIEAEQAWRSANEAGQTAQEYHLVLDEMNLARIEHYFAGFLSAMELLAQPDSEGSVVALQGDGDAKLTPNLRVIGTVNVDETTYGFSDKVYDRAQLVELDAPKDQLKLRLKDQEHAGELLKVWDAVHEVAPFAFRVVDDIAAYITEAKRAGATWQEALDEQILQKILPKLRGNDPRVGAALQSMSLVCAHMPLSLKRVEAMRQRFQAHGYASYF